MWVGSGAPWFFRNPPADWNPWAQLLKAGMLATMAGSETGFIIDSAFASISGDVDYQKQEVLIAEEFSRTDWEALEISERELAGVEG